MPRRLHPAANSAHSSAVSSTRADDPRYATGELLATLTHVARLQAALGLECRGCWGIRAEVERIDVKQVALRAVHGQLGHRATIRG